MTNEKSDDSIHDELRFVESLKKQWLAMIDALIDPIMIVSNDYQISKANKAMATIADTDVRSLIGEKCFKVFAGKNKPCTGCKLKDNVTNNTNDGWDLSRVHGDKFYEVTSQPLHATDGSIEGHVQVYRDRTEAKKLQRQLLQSEKLASIGLLAGGIAHEINNPLGGILIFSQVLLREMNPKLEHYQDVEEIHNAAQRCKAIVENLLDFARQKNEAEEAKVEAVDVQEAIETALRFALVGSPQHSMDILKNFADEAPLVLADRNKVIQVFLNLIQNAFHAMPEGGDLEIGTEILEDSTTNGTMVRTYIRDNGTGITKKDQKKVFDPFYTTKEPGEGTGLGLSICYSIIEEFDGTIFFDSTPGKGTTFNIVLPVANAKAEVMKPSA